MPPAAYWAAQGKMNFWMVVLAGTAGSWVGSSVSYWLAQLLGIPLLRKYGKYFLLPEKKQVMAENWLQNYGSLGVFFARLLPVVRHLISIPAGVFRMPFIKFSAVTTIGAGLWCLILSWFGQKILGDSPELLQSPETMVHVIKAKLIWFVTAIVLLLILYIFVLRLKRNSTKVS